MHNQKRLGRGKITDLCRNNSTSRQRRLFQQDCPSQSGLGNQQSDWEGWWLHSVVITVRTVKRTLNRNSVPSRYFFLLTPGRFTAECSPGPTQYSKSSPCNLLLWYTLTVHKGSIECTAKKWLIICIGYNITASPKTIPLTWLSSSRVKTGLRRHLSWLSIVNDE